jgi:hypothetical protein
MSGFEDDEGCAGEVESAASLMTNDVMTNDQKNCPDEKAAAPCDSLPREGREGYSQPGTTYEEMPEMEYPPARDIQHSEPGITYEERPNEDHTTPQDIQPPPMTNDVMPNDQKLIPKPYWGMKTSVIDMALTPELLDHILGKTMRGNSARGKGNDNFKPIKRGGEYRSE